MAEATILIVEDNLHNIALLKAHLASGSYRIEVAYDGEEALRTVKELQPDLIMLDIMLPGIDGFEVCRLLKNDRETQLIPIMMLTALDEMEAKIKGLDCGADEFLQKPFVPLELLCRVKSLIRIKYLMQQQIELERAKLEMQQLLGKEEIQRALLGECIFAITGGKLEILQDTGALDWPMEDSALLMKEVVREPEDVTKTRRKLENLGLQKNLPEERLFDFVLCCSEAMTNALRHGGGGELSIFEKEERLLVLVDDRGPGIEFSRIPSSTLQKGFSTKCSLGCGFTLMLQLSDKLYVSTGPEGTRVLLVFSLLGAPLEALPLLNQED